MINNMNKHMIFAVLSVILKRNNLHKILTFYSKNVYKAYKTFERWRTYDIAIYFLSFPSSVVLWLLPFVEIEMDNRSSCCFSNYGNKLSCGWCQEFEKYITKTFIFIYHWTAICFKMRNTSCFVAEMHHLSGAMEFNLFTCV